jgi:hypothetical protein
MSYKFKSRKLWVYIFGCLFIVITIIITKTVTPELINFVIFNQFFFNSTNLAQKWIYKDK